MFSALVDAYAGAGQFSAAVGLIEDIEAMHAYIPVDAIRARCRDAWDARRELAEDILARESNLLEGAPHSDSPVWAERFKFWLGMPNSLYDSGATGARNLLLPDEGVTGHAKARTPVRVQGADAF